MFIVMIDLYGNAPELGFWYFCKTMEEVHALAKEAGFKEMPESSEYVTGMYTEECGGGMIESNEDFAMRVVKVDLDGVRNEANIADLRKQLADLRGEGY